MSELPHEIERLYAIEKDKTIGEMTIDEFIAALQGRGLLKPTSRVKNEKRNERSVNQDDDKEILKVAKYALSSMLNNSGFAIAYLNNSKNYNTKSISIKRFKEYFVAELAQTQPELKPRIEGRGIRTSQGMIDQQKINNILSTEFPGIIIRADDKHKSSRFNIQQIYNNFHKMFDKLYINEVISELQDAEIIVPSSSDGVYTLRIFTSFFKNGYNIIFSRENYENLKSMRENNYSEDYCMSLLGESSRIVIALERDDPYVTIVTHGGLHITKYSGERGVVEKFVEDLFAGIGGGSQQ